LAVLKKYLTPAQPNEPAAAEEIKAADAEYEKWIQSGGATPNVASAPNGKPSYSYQDYEGAPLKQLFADEGLTPNDRATYLLSQRAAVLP
jgi:hypothetical protein